MQDIPTINFNAEKLDRVCRNFRIRLLILFGSRATSPPLITPESDLDLAVLLNPEQPANRFIECIQDLFELFSLYDADIALLNYTDPLFRYEVMKDGVLLFGDLDDFLEYRAFAFRDFMDSKDLRDLEEQLYNKKMAYIRKELDEAVDIRS